MARIAILFLVSLLGGALGAALYSSLTEPSGSVRSARSYDDRELRAEVDELRNDLKALALAKSSGPAESGERGAGRGAIAPPTETDVASPTAADGEPEKPAPKFVPSRYVTALKGKKFDSNARDRLLTTLSLNTEKIDDTIKELLAAVKADPDNAELQTALASAYTAKVAFATTPGPAQGIGFMKAVAAYNEAIRLDPNHWTARFGKAFDTSMAPEFIGMRPAAIREFEGLMTQQEARAPQPEFVRTYVRLGTLYKDAGNAEKARAIWKRGLQQFPESRPLSEALAVLDSK